LDITIAFVEIISSHVGFSIFVGKPGLLPCGLDENILRYFDWEGRNVFIFEIHVEITSVENILHYYKFPFFCTNCAPISSFFQN
jgi:hypothetical protein